MCWVLGILRPQERQKYLPGQGRAYSPDMEHDIKKSARNVDEAIKAAEEIQDSTAQVSLAWIIKNKGILE